MTDEELKKFLYDRGWPQSNIDIYLRDKCRCQYCGADGLESLDAYTHLVGDHVIPRDMNGEEDPNKNIVVACARCNGLKGSKLPVPPEELIPKSRQERVNKIKSWLEERRKPDREAWDAFRQWAKK
ncbi:HNH endonuclease [Myxococcota bacterium]